MSIMTTTTITTATITTTGGESAQPAVALRRPASAARICHTSTATSARLARIPM
jgi:hypothetical protein